MGLDMRDFERYAKEFESLKSEFESFLKNWIVKQAGILILKTKQRTPVDTGNLRNSWQIGKYNRQNQKAQIEINNNAEYASFVEYGTPARQNWKWADGAKMLTKSLYEMEQSMPIDFDEAFTSFLKSRGIL